MIKLQDFARECGVTDRAIQKHLKNHEKNLEGHFERRGKNGTWLDQTAQDYIRSLMVQQPIVVGDAETHREVEALKEENRALLKALNGAKDRIIELQDTRLQLEAAEREAKLLEGFVADAKAEIRTLTEEKAAEVAAARQEAAKATEERWRSMSVWEFLRERKKGD